MFKLTERSSNTKAVFFSFFVKKEMAPGNQECLQKAWQERWQPAGGRDFLESWHNRNGKSLRHMWEVANLVHVLKRRRKRNPGTNNSHGYMLGFWRAACKEKIKRRLFHLAILVQSCWLLRTCDYHCSSRCGGSRSHVCKLSGMSGLNSWNMILGCSQSQPLSQTH